MSKKTAPDTVGNRDLGRRSALRPMVGALPTRFHNLRNATGMHSLLKATLVMLAGAILALALTDPGLAKGGDSRQAPYGESVIAR